MNLFDIVKNRQGYVDGVREELALQLDTTTGGALSPESLEPIIVELVRKLSPLTSKLKLIQANGKTHEFNTRSALPTAEFEGEKASTQSSNSTYGRETKQLKIIRSKGGVTGFQQASSRKFANSYAKEIVGACMGMAFGIEYGLLWGNETADKYQFDGVDAQIVTNRFDVNAVVTLGNVDTMMDSVINQGITDFSNLVLIMSPQMKSKISSLQTEARIPVEKVHFMGGLRMDGYRDVPILMSSYCRPTGTFGAVGAADDGAAGLLVAVRTYKYKVAAVTTFGEQWCSAETSHVTGGGITSIKLTWTAIADARLYKIYRTAENEAADLEVLNVVIAAHTFDGDGTVTGNVTEYIDGIADASRLGTDVPLTGSTTADEVMFMLDCNQEYSLEIAGLLNEQGEKVENMIQMLPLARTKDVEEFLLLAYLAEVLKGEKYNAMSRRIRIA